MAHEEDSTPESTEGIGNVADDEFEDAEELDEEEDEEENEGNV